MSVEENIKTAEEHLEAEANRELDRLLGTLVEDCVYEESLLEKPGRSGEVKGVVVFPMKDGKALGERIYMDGFSLMTQLGVLPDLQSLSGRLLFSLLRFRLGLKSLIRRR